MKQRNKRHVRSLLTGLKKSLNKYKQTSSRAEYEGWFEDFAPRFPKIATEVLNRTLPQSVKHWSQMSATDQVKVLRRTRKLVRRKVNDWVRELLK